MGFRRDAYATVWSVEPISENVTKVRLSISRKNKQSGEYETEFSGFVRFIGTAAAQKASMLKERDRIKLGDVDVNNRYDKDKGVEYTYYKVFSFEKQTDGSSANPETRAQAPVDSGEIDDSELPF